MRNKVVGISIGILIITLLLLGARFSDYREKALIDTLELEPEDILKVSLSFKGKYRSTTDQQKIDELIHYLDAVQYQRLRGDQTAYMPMEASIIYLYGDDHIDFIVPYNDEAMISYKVYKVKEGAITDTFLHEYFDSIEE